MRRNALRKPTAAVFASAAVAVRAPIACEATTHGGGGGGGEVADGGGIVLEFDQWIGGCSLLGLMRLRGFVAV